MTINPKHFPDPEQWKTFAILLELADNEDADGNGIEKLQDFVMRAQVLLDHLLEHPEDIGTVGEYSPYPICLVSRHMLSRTPAWGYSDVIDHMKPIDMPEMK